MLILASCIQNSLLSLSCIPASWFQMESHYSPVPPLPPHGGVGVLNLRIVCSWSPPSEHHFTFILESAQFTDPRHVVLPESRKDPSAYSPVLTWADQPFNLLSLYSFLLSWRMIPLLMLFLSQAFISSGILFPSTNFCLLKWRWVWRWVWASLGWVTSQCALVGWTARGQCFAAYWFLEEKRWQTQNKTNQPIRSCSKHCLCLLSVGILAVLDKVTAKGWALEPRLFIQV